MPPKPGADLFIVDNGEDNWKVVNYLKEWASISHQFDIATGYFEIGALLALDGEWQKLDKIRILMGDEVSKRTKDAFENGLRTIQEKLDESLESYLNKKGIRFWRDVHDAKSGRLEKQIDQAMRLHPTVVLILSEHSLKSDWVEHEVRTARELEKELRSDMLCPVALDESWKKSSWPKRVMEQVMEYNILDFSEWKDDGKFENTLNKLIDGLGLFYK